MPLDRNGKRSNCLAIVKMSAPMFSSLKNVQKCLSCLCKSSKNTLHVFKRHYNVRELKKFYKNAAIVQHDGWFEINLDKRKLKTPGGNLFRVPHESLAMAVATEWNRQEEVVKRHDMHLTNLVNSCIDNPTRRTREDMIRGTLHFLETDTILYRLLEPPDLHDIQCREWDPLVKWTEKRYDIDITPTTGFELPQISDGTHDRLERHLQAFSDWSLLGFQYGVEALKSLIIMLALVDKHISVDKAVKLARLETDYQTDRWGNVEWYHDIDILQLRARLAASALLIQWTSESVKVREKSSLDSSQGW